MPADRALTHSEKQLKKLDDTHYPPDYDNILEKGAQFYKLGNSVIGQNWKALCEKVSILEMKVIKKQIL